MANIIVNINKDSIYSTLDTIFSNDNLIHLQNFYQYKMANTKDSPLSLKLDTTLSDTEKDALWQELLSSANTVETNFIFIDNFSQYNSDILQLHLSDTNLLCDRLKGFLQKKKTIPHKIDILFNRIRNSFAHGRIAKVDSYLIFEDKTTNQLTARIVLTENVLINWKKSIELFLEKSINFNHIQL